MPKKPITENKTRSEFGGVSVPVFLAGLVAFAAPTSAQDFGTALLLGLGQKAISEGQDLLDEAPSMMDNMLKSAEQGKTYASPQDCLGALQVAVNAGAVAANLLPFSSVQTFEDKRGPVGRFRVLVNGEKVHIEAFCREEQFSAAALPWGEGEETPVTVSQSSFDAAAGLLLLLQAQGAFADDKEDVAALIPPETQPDAQPFTSDAIAEAFARALPKTDVQVGRPPDEQTGAPMTTDERDALRVNILQCWNVGSLSSEALRTTITVAFSISEDGRPDGASLRMIGSEGGSEEAARQTFESARRAIIRCGANGLKLPMDKYDQWSDVELTFNPVNMRIR